MINRYWLLVLMFGWVGVTKAQTIYGSSMSRSFYSPTNDNPFNYQISILLFTGKNEVAKLPKNIAVYLYRKKDHQLISTVTATIIDDPARIVKETYTHLCNPAYSLDIEQVNYELTTVLDPSLFNDLDGYYFVTEPFGNRPKVDNHSSDKIVLYHWFSPKFLFGPPNGSAPGKTATFMAGILRFNCVDSKQGIPFYTFPSLQDRYLVSPPPALDIKARLTAPQQAAPNGILQDVTWQPSYSITNPYPNAPWQFIRSNGGNGEALFTATPSTNIPSGTYTIAAIYEQYYYGEKVSEGLAEQTVFYTTCPKIPPTTIVYNKPDGTRLSTPPALCQSQSLTVTAITTTPNQQYTWFKNGQPIPNQTTTSLPITQPGSYSLQITQTGICDTLRMAFSIPPATPISLSLVSNATSLTSCTSSRPISITAIAPNATEYTWYDGKNAPVPGTDQTGVLNIVQPGVYTVRVKNTDGCTAVSSTTINSAVSPTASILPPVSTTFCAGSSGVLKAQKNTDYTYEWLRDGVTTGVMVDSIKTIATGSYTVKITNSAGCTAISTPVTLQQIPVQQPSVVGDMVLCLGKTVTLNTNPATAITYQWYRDGQAEPNGKSAQYTIGLAGQYTIKVTYANGCTAISPGHTVLQAEKIPVSIEAIAPVCLSNTSPIPLRATPAGGTFSGQGVINNQFIPTVAGVGSFTITYQPNSTSSCASGSAQQVIVVRPAPVIVLPHYLETSAGQPLPLPGTSTGGTQYQWSPPTFLDNPALPNPTSTPTTSITYRLTVTDAFGCSATDTIRVELIHGVYIPTAFTPNGDGVNDSWILTGIGGYPQIEVIIYNRWGEVVFSSTGYIQPFAGLYQGEPMPVGIYTYVIRLKPGEKPIRGSITLLR